MAAMLETPYNIPLSTFSHGSISDVNEHKKPYTYTKLHAFSPKCTIHWFANLNVFLCIHCSIRISALFFYCISFKALSQTDVHLSGWLFRYWHYTTCFWAETQWACCVMDRKTSHWQDIGVYKCIVNCLACTEGPLNKVYTYPTRKTVSDHISKQYWEESWKYNAQ